MEDRKLIDLWMKYCWNYSTRLVEGEYAPQILICTSNPKWFVSKFQELTDRYGSGTFGLLYLWHEMGASEQESVVTWLKENYKG